MNPKVSIIIPVEGPADTTRRCLTSLVKQTYDNIEVVLSVCGAVDQGFLDQLASILDGCRSWKRVGRPETMGLGTALNLAVDAAGGDWLMFVNPVDYLPDDGVDSLVSQVQFTTLTSVLGRT